jgi:hypothetical protein
MSDQKETAAKQVSLICLSRCFQPNTTKTHRSSGKRQHDHAPTTTSTRLSESLDDAPLDPSLLVQDLPRKNPALGATVLYLAYGSNLCRETFRKSRGIKPVSQVNVVVPELVMTFDLAGVPYTEPCFANTRHRRLQDPEREAGPDEKEGYHKDAWHKGLVGVVYEVTLADYAHIIATEGGGASYEDVLVDCYTLPADPSTPVPREPSGNSFKAHTLFAPAALASKGGRLARPDPGYAQPSPRYLKLITDGADELTLPHEYQDYLHSIRGYQITTTKQRLGQFIFLSIWAPVLAFVVGAGRLFADEKGRYPPWLATLAANIFTGIWTSYDSFFKDVFGDGERTMKPGSSQPVADEEQPLMLGRGVGTYEYGPAEAVRPHLSVK